jgi:hypothetical protein
MFTIERTTLVKNGKECITDDEPRINVKYVFLTVLQVLVGRDVRHHVILGHEIVVLPVLLLTSGGPAQGTALIADWGHRAQLTGDTGHSSHS